MFSVAHGLVDTSSSLNRTSPGPPPSPNLLVRFTLAGFGDTQPSFLEVIEHPQPHRPRRQSDVNHVEPVAGPERTGSVSLGDPRLERGEEFFACFGESVGGVLGVLEEAVEGRDDSGGYVVDPDLCASSVVGIGGEEGRWRGDLIKVFADYVGFVEGFGGVVFLRAGEGGHEASRVQLKGVHGFQRDFS